MKFVVAESGRRYRRYQADDLAMAEDFAHRAAIAIENAWLYRELRDADRRQDEFLAMLAHELRNPLAPIRSGLDLDARRFWKSLGFRPDCMTMKRMTDSATDE